MRRLAMLVGTSAMVVSMTGAPAGAHQLDPAYGSCQSRGGQLAGALWNQPGHQWDRNGDGVVCLYIGSKGTFRYGDNHVHRH